MLKLLFMIIFMYFLLNLYLSTKIPLRLKMYFPKEAMDQFCTNLNLIVWFLDGYR